MELQHFSHEHPLILREEKQHDGEEVLQYCNGCLKEVISGPYYCCRVSCDYSLHKLCAELPREMKHPKHPEHPLTLLAKPSYDGGDCICDVCDESWNSFVYHCSLCNFDVDVICVLLECRLEQCHEHPLIPLRRPVLSLCDACNMKHEGKFYLCINCQFWVHRECASLPSTVKHIDHDHPLTLTYSLPYEVVRFNSFCDICAKQFDKECWVYHCPSCKYCAHVNCAASKTEAFMSILLPDRKTKNLMEDDDPNLIHLPVSNEFVSLISHFLKMNMGEKKKETELNHFSHDHLLILFDVQGNDESCSKGKPSPSDDMENDNICDGCVQPISTPFYSCPQCNFFLHKCCAELPTQLQHPCHPQHPLVLLAKCPQFCGFFKCQVCRGYCNGFTFSCVSCEFFLDVNCASLTRTIIHEAHAHHRLILKQPRDGICKACPNYFRDREFAFVCDTCDFKLHLYCAMLPHNVRHRYEEHNPLTLTYSPIKDNSNEYFCEICEEELNPKKWFYHSGDCGCDFWFHMDCVQNRLSKVKYGSTIKISCHPHHLTFVQKVEREIFNCNHCDEYFFKLFFFECSQCNFKLSCKCVRYCDE